MDNHILESRIKGSLWGLAVGDALGAPYEFRHRGTYVPSKDMVVCTTFSHNGKPLPAGSWTDDTSMQLCLAQSLSSTGGELDWVDAARRWVSWWKHGYMSVIGTCFDIGVNTRLSLLSYSKLINPEHPRPTHTPNMHPEIEASGNGSLMRLSPVPAALHRNPSLAIKTASLQSKITHASPLCVDSSKERKQRVLNSDFTPFSDGTPIPLESAEIMALHKRHPYKEKSVVDIKTSGYVLATLEAALWALWHTDTFEEGLMLLLPLGDDVDTVGAVYGELAGACYGYDEIPTRWLDGLQKRDMLEETYSGVIELALKP
ncbi:hypothetical protein OPQ81_009567 [Rhizoctonia solani]|nr:hypothetical protein OPQ81_009567 [Rhizoctonia solani]